MQTILTWKLYICVNGKQKDNSWRSEFGMGPVSVRLRATSSAPIVLNQPKKERIDLTMTDFVLPERTVCKQWQFGRKHWTVLGSAGLYDSIGSYCLIILLTRSSNNLEEVLLFQVSWWGKWGQQGSRISRLQWTGALSCFGDSLPEAQAVHPAPALTPATSMPSVLTSFTWRRFIISRAEVTSVSRVCSCLLGPGKKAGNSWKSAIIPPGFLCVTVPHK